MTLFMKLCCLNFSETTIKDVLSEKHAWKEAQEAKPKNTNFWHFWKQGLLKDCFVATPNLDQQSFFQKQPNKKQNPKTRK